MERQFNDKSPVVNQSLFNPDWIYGMMCPKAPWVNKNLIWHMYSGQAYGTYYNPSSSPLSLRRHVTIHHSPPARLLPPKKPPT